MSKASRLAAEERYRENLRFTEERLRAIDRATDAEGYLIDQRRLGEIPFGRRFSDYNGCGWVAVYNALRLLGERPRVADLVRELERGSLLGGRAGVAPWRITRFLRQRGLRLRLAFRRKTIERLSAEGEAGVVLYLRRRLAEGAHYVAFRPLADARCRFFNARWGAEDDLRTIGDLFAAERPLAAMLISIGRPEQTP